MSHLREIGLALQNYHDNQHVFPPGLSYLDDRDPFPFMSWNARLLPYLEQDELWNRTVRAYGQDPRFLDDPPHIGLKMVLQVFSCPADARTLRTGKYAAFTAYLGVEGQDLYSEDGVLFLNSRIRLADISDGTSNTISIGERPPSADEAFGWWYAGEGQAKEGSGDMVLGVRELNVGSLWGRGCPPGPFEFQSGKVSNQCDAFHFWSLHDGGGHFLYADGSVHFLSYNANAVLPALATRAGGEAVEPP